MNAVFQVRATEAVDVASLPADALLTRKQVSVLTGFAIITLKHWAAEGKGPAIVRVEGRPRHRVGDVRAWLSGQGNN